MVVTSPGVILRLSLGLAILYGLVVIVWYQVLSSTVVDRILAAVAEDSDEAVWTEVEDRVGKQHVSKV